MELHQSGESHLHCFLLLPQPLVVNDPAFWDLSEPPVSYHGNYRSCRNNSAVKKYCTKEDNYISNMDLALPPKKQIWMEARRLASIGELNQALSLLSSTEEGSKYLTLYPAIQTTLRTLAPPIPLSVTHAVSSYEFPSQHWPVHTKTLVLYGATNVGKTSLAIALLPMALMTRHLDLLSKYASGHYEGIILDDMAFLHLHREAQIALLDRVHDTQIHVRYKVASLPAGCPLIITSNKHPGDVVFMHDPAIARRVVAIEMLSPTNFSIYQPPSSSNVNSSNDDAKSSSLGFWDY